MTKTSLRIEEESDLADRRVHHVDKLYVEESGFRELVVVGWAGNEDLEAYSSIRIELAGRRIPLRAGLVRGDVEHKFATPKMARPGFAGRVHLNGETGYFHLIGRDAAGREAKFVTARIPSEARVFPGADPKLNCYPAWLAQHEEKLFWRNNEIANRIKAFRRLPLISVIVPTFNTDPYHLYRCVYCLLNQHYPNWELCIGDDGSRNRATLEMLEEICALDSRIKLRIDAKNGGISSASMAAAEMAEGEFIALLDHDDELHPHALLEMAKQVNLTPDADLIYSDEDKINEWGERSHPAFKPPFDPEMLLGYCYVGHLVCLRASVFRAVGGLRTAFDGAQDWDLWIRATEAIHHSRIHHIPKPLYHWRMHPDSTAMNLDSKPYSQAAWRLVLEDCARRRGLRAGVERGLFLGSMRLRHEIPAGTRTAVVLRLEDGSGQLSIAQRARIPVSTKFYELFLSTLRDLESGEIAVAAGELAADVAIFINLPLDCLNHCFYEELVSQCMREGCALVGGILADERGKHAGGALETRADGTLLNPADGTDLTALGYMGRFRVVHSVPAVAPYFFAVRMAVLQEAGGLAKCDSENSAKLPAELAALCHRKGLKVLFTPYAIATALRPFESGAGCMGMVAEAGRLAINPNLNDFPELEGFLRYGV